MALALFIGLIFGVESFLGLIYFARAWGEAKEDRRLAYDAQSKEYAVSQIKVMFRLMASQIAFLVAGSVFFVAVLYAPPPTAASAFRSVVVPLLLIVGETFVLVTGYELARARKKYKLENGDA